MLITIKQPCAFSYGDSFIFFCLFCFHLSPDFYLFILNTFCIYHHLMAHSLCPLFTFSQCCGLASIVSSSLCTSISVLVKLPLHALKFSSHPQPIQLHSITILLSFYIYLHLYLFCEFILCHYCFGFHRRTSNIHRIFPLSPNCFSFA